MSLSRRDMLKVSALGAGALVLPFEQVVRAKDASDIAANKVPRPYTLPFKVPPVKQATGRTVKGPYGDVPLYEITQKAADVEILPGVKTQIFGYDGIAPGPTLLVERGRPIAVKVINDLPAKHPRWNYEAWTSVHLHGSDSLPQYDGYASDITNPKQEKIYHYPNDQDARTLWYHDHGLHHTAENAYMGLAGLYIMTDPDERALPLPQGFYDPATKTGYDVPLVISDKMFASNGQLKWDDEGHSGLYGDVVLVNGQPWPFLDVEPRKYRFRLLNASLSRGFNLKLSNGAPMTVIGTDGGLMPAPQDATTLRFGMAERYEIVIDFARFAGQKIQLTNLGVKNSRDFDHTGKVMEFRVGTTVTNTANNEVPAELNKNTAVMGLKESDATSTVKLRLHRSNGEWKVNDQTWVDVERSEFQAVLANPSLGETQIWEIENSSGGWFHPTHIHLVDFKMLTRNGQPVFNYEQGPKDVAFVGENETVRLVVKFEREGRYMIHCHNLPHEDHDMMHQFRVGKDYGPEEATKFNDPMGVKAVALGTSETGAVTPPAGTPTTTTSSSVAPTTTTSAPAPTTTTSARSTTTTRQTTTRQTTTRPTTTTRRR